MKTKPRWLGRELVNLYANLVICFSQKEYSKFIKYSNYKGRDNWMPDGAQAVTVKFFNMKKVKGDIICVCFQSTKSKSKDIGNLIHEAVHVWQYHVGATHNKEEPSAEFEAYSIQAIATTLIHA